MTWSDGLEGPHYSIAASEQRRIGVLAGPGTGKTSYGLMRRVVRLLEEGVSGERILLLSFTRVAAADLRDKVALLDAPGIDRVKATTLHGYCFGLLQQNSVLAITGRTPRILLGHESDLMLRDIGGHFGTIHERRRRLEAFVAGWARGIDDHPGTGGGTADREFEHDVMMWLREHKAMLIGEVVPEAYRYLATNPQAEALDAFEHIVVDEYQDLNVLEQSLLDQLASRGNLCIAGDDDQSIYSVRYANPAGILTFLARPEVESHSIQVCGRCPTNIVAMANALIRHAPGRTKSDLAAREPASQGTVAILQWPDVEAEVDGIVSAIALQIRSQEREPGQILILTNWRRIGERIRARLVDIEIPARSFFTEEELDSDAGRESLALLRMVVNGEDLVALRVFLGLGDAAGRTGAYQRLLTYCRAKVLSTTAVLQRLANHERLGLNIPAIVDRFKLAVTRVDQLRQLELSALVDALFPDGQEATADLRSVARDGLNEADGAEDLLRIVIEAVTQDAVPQNPDFVRIMSLHKSKGLTSPCVYVAAAVHGIIPTIRSDEPSAVDLAIQEGRRLFYVALTRAAKELVISGSTTMALADANARGVRFASSSIRRRAGEPITITTIASPYLAELGASAPRSQRGVEWLATRS